MNSLGVIEYVCVFISYHYLHLFARPILSNLPNLFVLHDYFGILSNSSEIMTKAFDLLILAYIKHFITLSPVVLSCRIIKYSFVQA